MRVLYLSHTSRMSGGEHSLLALISGLPDDVTPILACPPGLLENTARARGVTTVRVPGTDGSLKLHPRHTTRTLIDLARAGLAVRRIASAEKVDVVHANSVRAGLAAVLAERLGGPPAVVHVRDCPPEGRVANLTLRMIGKGASLAVANSEHTRRRFETACDSASLKVAYSPVDLARFNPRGVNRARERARLGIGPSTFVMTLVAQLTPWKAQDDAVRMAARLKSSHPDVRLLLVGSAKFVSSATRHDNRLFVRQLEELIESLDMQGEVLLMGERSDVPEILAASDVLLLPSWEEPFGRSVVEAMAMGVPVLATSVGGPAEAMDGAGVLLPPRDPDAWVGPLEELLQDPERRTTMGRRGRERAVAQFGVDGHVRQMVGEYEQLLAG
ncbi:MAG TPA: glycosyltransferase [Thermoleophilaceae bacterium]|nr:glycosyltransferase [Thermoleophilaceae bacterium]